MRRALVGSGALLLGLTPLTALALRLVPFDFVFISPVPLPSVTALMMLGVLLLLAGLLWRRP